MDGVISSSSSTELRIQTDSGHANGSSPSSSSSPFKRKIEFHPARKPFTGFINGAADFRIETLNPSSDPKWHGSGPGQSVMIGKKLDGSDFLEGGLDPELSFGITVRKIGAGLENLGNTCFLNSVLQCLTYTEPLAAYLQSGKHRNSCNIAGFCALCAIQKHVSRALQASGRILAPKDLVSNLRCISRSFRNARQEDAHEYMVNLLESMHKCCLPSGVPSESPSAYEKSLVHKIFGGRLRSQVKCMQCSHCSNTFDPFLDLSLEIVKADSLHKAFTQFTAAELLDGGEREYRCERCKQKVRALKQLTVDKAPYVLTIHLKRFRAHDPGKINKNVQFGPTLDMKPFVSGSYEGDLKYTLYGVLVHYGWSIHSGHYYCFVRTSSGMWHSLDDNRVVQVSERTVLEQKAYMLFYVRDRKNIVPRKPIEVVQKENMKANVTVNKTCSIFPQISKGWPQNGSIESRLHGADSVAAMTQKDATYVGLSKETLLKEASSQQTNGKVAAKCSLPKEEPAVEPTLSAPLSEAPLEAPVLNPDVGALQPSAPCLNGNANTPKLEDISTSTGAQIGDCTKDKNSRKSSELPITISPNCSSPQIRATHKLASNETLQKINLVSDAGSPKINTGGDSTDSITEGVLSIAPSGCSSESIDPAQSPNKPSCENSQVVATSVVNDAGNSLNEEAGNNGKKTLPESVDLPTLLGMTKASLEMKAPDCFLGKSKKKPRKCQFKNMHIGLKIFRVSLGLRKKMNYKRIKRRTLDTQNLRKKLLVDRKKYSSDLGPSTSETCSLGSTHSQRKFYNGTTPKNVKNRNGDSLMDATVRKFSQRICQNGSVLGAYQELQKSSGSVLEARQQDAREPECPKDSTNGMSENEMMSVLTRGLEEPVVARWDDLELPQIVESKRMSISIGHVGDEWDEEYDRGKIRKVRCNKHSFDGPNPFQVIAGKKTQLKKAKIDRSSSGSIPFRI